MNKKKEKRRGEVSSPWGGVTPPLQLIVTIGLCLFSFFLSGCGPKAAEADVENAVVTINQLRLGPQDLKQELDTTWIHDQEAAPEGEPEWVSRLVEREILVQEAQKQGIDRDPAFMRTIERFWKEALMKILLDRKTREISSRIQVYEPEIEAYYKELVDERAGQPVEPLSELRDEIRREIRQEKEAGAVDQWIAELREKAEVTVDREALSQLG